MALSENLSYTFREGALMLSATGIEMRLKWEPVPLAEMRYVRGQWQPFYPEFRIVAQMGANNVVPNDEGLRAKNEAFAAFRACLPEDIVLAVEPFTCHQWPMMALLRASMAAGDLARANPVLAYALANNAQIRGVSIQTAYLQAGVHSHNKQRDILGWLGFPATDAMGRILKKVSPGIAYPGLIRKVRQCVQNPEVLKIFGHLPSLNTGAIFLASHPDMVALISPKLVQEVADASDEEMSSPTADLLSEIVTAATEMHNKSRLRPFSSRRKVLECHQRISMEFQAFKDIVRRQEEIKATQRRLANESSYKGQVPAYQQEKIDRLQAEYKRLEMARPDRMAMPATAHRLPAFSGIGRDELRALRFPAPPIPGDEVIIPLTCFAEMEAEAVAQSNCLGLNLSYLDRIMRGEIYLYRVMVPERHTLSIVRRGNGYWQIAELRQSKNIGRTDGAEALVSRWLSMNQLSL